MAGKVLVTGACGIIGTELCNQLKEQGYFVVAVDSGFRFSKFASCDVFVKESIEKFVSTTLNDFDYIFHMGNINGTKYFYNIPNQLLENNIGSDFAIFNYTKQKVNCKLIYASSSEVVAGTTNFPTDEEKNISISNIHNPRWSYRLGKIVGENYLLNSNLNYVIIRFFNVYSENSGSGHFLKDLIEKIQSGNFELIGANETRCFCYVKDAVDAVLNIKNISNEIVNVGSDEEICILDAANLIANFLDIKNVKWKTKAGLIGSVKRRKPDLSNLRKHYPSYSPEPFAKRLNKIIEKKK